MGGPAFDKVTDNTVVTLFDLHSPNKQFLYTTLYFHFTAHFANFYDDILPVKATSYIGLTQNVIVS